MDWHLFCAAGPRWRDSDLGIADSRARIRECTLRGYREAGAGTMSQRSTAAGARSGEEVMKSLKQRPDLPSRVRSLLEGLLERSANQFEHAIARTLDEVEQELFKLADRSRSNEHQHTRFE